jgi:PAS domain S-box-containing protein
MPRPNPATKIASRYKTKDWLQLAAQGSELGLWYWDEVRRKLDWDLKTREIFGVSKRAKVKLETFVSALHPDDRDSVVRHWRSCVEDGLPYSLVMRIVRPDGAVRWVEGRGRGYYNKEGKPLSMVGVVFDVTEREQAEHARLRHAAVVESSADAIISKDLNGVIVSWNAGAKTLFGYSEDEAVGQPITILIPPELREEEERIFEKLRSGGRIEHYETKRVTKAGNLVDVSLRIGPIKDSTGTAVGYSKIAHDITQRKQADDALRESEERFRNVFRDTGVGMVIVSPDGQYLAANRAFCDCLGYSEEELLQKTVESITLPEDWPAFSERLTQTLKQGSSFRWIQKRCLHKSGRIVYTESSASLIRNRDGSPKYFVADVLDITSRKEAEEVLSSMTRKLIDAQEQERARIGRELHDDITQRLAMLAVELENLQDDPSGFQRRGRELRKAMTEIAEDVQGLSHELHSSRLEYLGVVAGIRSWCKEFGRRQKINIEFSGDVPNALSQEIGLTLLRILQEALHNVVKHSGARKVSVQLREDAREIHLIVSDGGKGFETERALRGEGLGLTSMRERVRLVNGTIAIDSKPMGGTRIHARVPRISEQRSALVG